MKETKKKSANMTIDESQERPANGLPVLFEQKLPAGVTKAELTKMFEADLQRTGEGVIPRLQQIKILHAGTLRFEIPSDEEIGEAEQVKTFRGIIIDQHPCNAYWKELFAKSGGGNLPDCTSLDGKTGTEYGVCANCEFNKFGSGFDESGKKTQGKACKNMKRLSILRDGHQLPDRLTLPPTSIKEADTFFSALMDRKMPMTALEVEFSLAEAKSKQGIGYSQIRFKVVSQINLEKYLEIQNFVKTHLAAIRGQEILPDEYLSEEEKQGQNYAERTTEEAEREIQGEKEDGDLPF